MKKEYLTARLFKNRSAYDMNTEEELQDSYQPQSSDSAKKNETTDSSEDTNSSSLPQRFLGLLQKVVKAIRT